MPEFRQSAWKFSCLKCFIACLYMLQKTKWNTPESETNNAWILAKCLKILMLEMFYCLSVHASEDKTKYAWIRNKQCLNSGKVPENSHAWNILSPVCTCFRSQIKICLNLLLPGLKIPCILTPFCELHPPEPATIFLRKSQTNSSGPLGMLHLCSPSPTHIWITK